MVRAGCNVIATHRTSMSSPCASPSPQFSVRTIRRVIHTHKCLSIEIGDILVIVSIVGVFFNAYHLGASDSVNSPIAWGVLNAACAGFAVVGGLRRNPIMLIPYMVTLVIDTVTGIAALADALYNLLSKAKNSDNSEEALYSQDSQDGSSTREYTWLIVAKILGAILLNLIFYYVCHAARGVFKNERCRKECCVLPLPYRSPQISHRSPQISHRSGKSSRSNSYDSAYETISAVSVQVPIRFRMDQPPPYRVRRESGNSDKVSEKRKSSLAVVPVSTKRRLPSLRLSSVTESHNELYQNTWHGSTVPAGRSPSHHSNDSIFNEPTPRHSYPIARQGYRHVSITESHNELYANASISQLVYRLFSLHCLSYSITLSILLSPPPLLLLLLLSSIHSILFPMFWLVAPSVVAVSTTAILAGCAKGRDEVKRPKSSGSNRGSNKQKQSGKSTRKPGASSRSGSSRRDPKAVGAAGVKKTSRSKREGHSNKSGRSSKSASGKPIAEKKKVGSAAAPVTVAGGAPKDKSSKSAGKSSSSKRRSEKDKLKKEKSVDGSEKRSSRSKKSKSKRSSRSKKSASKKEVKKELQVDKTQEMSGEDLPHKPKDAAVKTALSPQAVSVTKLELAPVEGVAKHEIRIEPSELRWNSTGGIQSVAIYNHSNSRKALKIKCSDNLLYRVNPVHAFIPAGGSVRVDILRQNGTAKVDKIVIVAADAGKDEANAREVLNRSMNTDMMVLPLIATAVN
ncbi:hypothetical protein PRIPAC_75622 [Pristionchus pacificus]|uniref:Major sperm protein n=1 Tax=Pristionchus pacificus TaxID=54126 RepID=A0A2A6CZS0_PRIPA|nr:hypothetical protein PRIPAC_75622 [Pristionchus pacificus]|eukprot:PDM83628.1 MSP domain-containing protein [Pristionchus pacificus]